MSETVRHVMTHVTTRQQRAIHSVTHLKPKGGRSAAEAQAFLEGRLKEAERIDPQTCEYVWWYFRLADPYNIFEDDEALGDCDHGFSDRGYFVRNVPDGSWVWADDLPEHIYRALVELRELS